VVKLPRVMWVLLAAAYCGLFFLFNKCFNQQNPHDPRQLDPRELDLWSSFLLETNRTHEVGFPKVLLVQFPAGNQQSWFSSLLETNRTHEVGFPKVEPSVMLVQFPSVQWVSHRFNLRSERSSSSLPLGVRGKDSS
jgi:hypothetical protein